MNNHAKTLGTISLILGIISLVIFCIPVVSLVIALTGLILGIFGINAANKSDGRKSSSVAGTIISSLALILTLLFNSFIFNNWDGNFFDISNRNNHNEFYENYDTNYTDIDSLLMNDNEIDDLNPVMTDPDNGPGPAPE